MLGRIATANGEATAAIKWGEEAQGEGPEEGAVLVHLFIAFAAAKKWSHAASTLALAIAKRPEIADLHQHQGIYLSNAGQFSEADVARYCSLGCIAEGWLWYWFNEGDTSPWYSNVTLCRSDG